MLRRTLLILLVIGMVNLAALTRTAAACPFCTAQSKTFAEEIVSMDVVAIARMVAPTQVATPTEEGATVEVSKSKFEIVEVLKGDSHLANTKVVEALYYGEVKKDQSYLLMGVDPPKLMWSTPLPLSPRARKYLGTVATLPLEGSERLKFFQQHLEDEDEMLARDAFDEFARSPYEDVIALKNTMDHDRLIAWIKSTDVPASRRRLYLTMLGVCGGMADVMFLEELLNSTDRKQKAGLDALIGCYLTLKGADGMELVEDLFLKNKQCEYADTYAAIMALRFHGTETDIIPRERILVGLRYMLERPKLADLVIPDLARWEDWSSMETLVTLFKEADEKTSWVRVPVINYLRACPLPKAAEYIKELEEIDPAAVKRANTFFPFARPAPKDEPAAEEPAEKEASKEAKNSAAAPSTSMNVVDGDALAAAMPTSTAHDNRSAIVERKEEDHAPNLSLFIGVPVLAGVVLFGLQFAILRGSRKPAST